MRDQSRAVKMSFEIASSAGAETYGQNCPKSPYIVEGSVFYDPITLTE